MLNVLIDSEIELFGLIEMYGIGMVINACTADPNSQRHNVRGMKCDHESPVAAMRGAISNHNVTKSNSLLLFWILEKVSNNCPVVLQGKHWHV